MLGGTFDPVHIGHLRFAIEFRDAIAGSEGDNRVHLIPCHIPPHRDPPLASAQQRLEMLRLAIGERPGLHIDRRELQSDAVSYSIDTLLSLAREYPGVQLILALGTDAFEGFCRWHRWRDIFELASLLVCIRPGSRSAPFSAAMQQRRVGLDELRAPGQIATLDMTPVDISSSQIRRLISSGDSIDDLLPAGVSDYIYTHNLYRK